MLFEFLHPHIDLVGRDGFEQVIERAELHRLDRIFDRAERGDHDDGRLGVAVPDLLEQLHPGHAGHAHISEDNVRRLTLKLFPRIFTIAGDHDLVSVFEGLVKKFAGEGVVVSDQDFIDGHGT